jgi:hypothetical protein
MDWEDLELNDHAWALMDYAGDPKLVVIIKDSMNSASVCGPWEGSVSPRKLEIISKIDPPKGHENTPLYYGEDY